VRQFHVYILASRSRRLYVGVTSDIVSRIHRHKHHVFPGFTAQYNIVRLVYFETTSNSVAAITREKQLKRWPRPRKIRLIELHNPDWRDLSNDWYEL
jgi:putative endonuclease